MHQAIEQIKKLEGFFSSSQYCGSGGESFFLEEGSIPVMVSAPHAVNQYREGKIKWAEMYTGGIARYLHEVTGCHLICAGMYAGNDPNYDEAEKNPYQKALAEYLKKHKVYILLDIHGAAKEREYAVEIGTAPEQDPVPGIVYEEDPSLHEYKFAADLVREIFERWYAEADTEQKKVWKNRIFDAGGQNTVTKYISENTNTACMQLEINGNYRNPDNEDAFMRLVNALTEIIQALASAVQDGNLKEE